MLGFSDYLRQGLERYGKFYGTYYGIVYRNRDTSGRGKLAVIVPLVSKDVLKTPALPKGQWQGGKYGQYMIPEVGDSVLVEFINGDLNFPVWSFGPMTTAHTEGGENSDTFNNRVYRFKTPAGFSVEINESMDESSSTQNNYIQVITPKGNTFMLDDEKETLKFNIKSESNKTELTLNMDAINSVIESSLVKDDVHCNVTLNGDGKVILQGNGDDRIELDANGRVIMCSGESPAVDIKLLTDYLSNIQKTLSGLVKAFNGHQHPVTGTVSGTSVTGNATQITNPATDDTNPPKVEDYDIPSILLPGIK